MPKHTKNNATNEDKDSLGFLVNRAGRMMGRILREKMVATGIEMPYEQWVILFLLWRKDGQAQNDIVQTIFKDKGTITRGLDSLEKLNYVVRIKDEQDKRKRRIYLTHKGKEMQKTLIPLAEATTKLAIADIDDEELRICKKVLIKIFENLDEI